MPRRSGILTENIEELHRLARGLLEHETLSGDEIRTVLRGEPVIRKVVDEPAPESRRASVPTAGRPAAPRRRPAGWGRRRSRAEPRAGAGHAAAVEPLGLLDGAAAARARSGPGVALPIGGGPLRLHPGPADRAIGAEPPVPVACDPPGLGRGRWSRLTRPAAGTGPA